MECWDSDGSISLRIKKGNRNKDNPSNLCFILVLIWYGWRINILPDVRLTVIRLKFQKYKKIINRRHILEARYIILLFLKKVFKVITARSISSLGVIKQYSLSCTIKSFFMARAQIVEIYYGLELYLVWQR